MKPEAIRGGEDGWVGTPAEHGAVALTREGEAFEAIERGNLAEEEEEGGVGGFVEDEFDEVREAPLCNIELEDEVGARRLQRLRRDVSTEMAKWKGRRRTRKR
jgi:hypothetical protein